MSFYDRYPQTWGQPNSNHNENYHHTPQPPHTNPSVNYHRYPPAYVHHSADFPPQRTLFNVNQQLNLMNNSEPSLPHVDPPENYSSDSDESDDNDDENSLYAQNRHVIPKLRKRC